MRRTLLPDAAALHREEVLTDDDAITMVVSTSGETAICPGCGRTSARRHSRRCRTIADLPWQGLAVRVELHFRRYYCDTPACERHTFTEPLPTVVAPYARRSRRLATLVEAVACALGGEAGARLLAELGLTASPDTLLRLIQTAPLPVRITPRVLGVDDWALRRGRTYGSSLVDLERRCPVDLLPDRSAATFAAWLKDHPGVASIARDRGGAYADGARQGAPQAIQIADRFHLVKNLTEVLERVLQRHHAALATAAAHRTQAARAAAAPSGAPADAAPLVASQLRTVREQVQRQARRQTRYADVRQLRTQGLGVRAIARETGLARNTVRRFLAAPACPDRPPRPVRATALTPYEDDLRERWQAGCENAAALHRAIQVRGYTGSAGLVRRLLAAWRGGPARRGRPPRGTGTAPSAPPVRARSPRQARWLLLRDEATLAPTDRAYRDQREADCPEATAARALAHTFHALVRARDHTALAPWLAAAEACALPEFRAFAAGLRRDVAAVAAALTQEWSSGQVAGQVNKLQLIKRAMFGRAGFPLLRRRVLRAA